MDQANGDNSFSKKITLVDWNDQGFCGFCVVFFLFSSSHLEMSIEILISNNIKICPELFFYFDLLTHARTCYFWIKYLTEVPHIVEHEEKNLIKVGHPCVVLLLSLEFLHARIANMQNIQQYLMWKEVLAIANIRDYKK